MPDRDPPSLTQRDPETPHVPPATVESRTGASADGGRASAVADRPEAPQASTPGAAPAAGAGQRLPSSLPWLAVATAALIGLSLLWLAAEQHYQGCVRAVEVRSAGTSSLDRLVRDERLDGCSRLPF